MTALLWSRTSALAALVALLLVSVSGERLLAAPPADEEFDNEKVRTVAPTVGRASLKSRWTDPDVSASVGKESFRCCIESKCIRATSDKQCRAHRDAERGNKRVSGDAIARAKLDSDPSGSSAPARAELVASLSRCAAQDFGYRPDQLSGEHFVCDVDIDRACEGSGAVDVRPRRIVFRGVTSAQRGEVALLEEPTDGSTYRIVVSERTAEGAHLAFDVHPTTECPK